MVGQNSLPPIFLPSPETAFVALARAIVHLRAHGPVAQRIERPPPKGKVAGSNPAGVARNDGGTVTRPPDLQAFLDLSAHELIAVTWGQAARAAERLDQRLRAETGAMARRPAERLAVCDSIGPALQAAAKGPRGGLAAAFAALDRQLAWKRRQSADPANSAFWNGHANAMILGPGGLEDRADVWIGATVMAPGVTYADHDHPPEEIYLPLAAGEWWNAEMDWTDPGPEGVIYNPPGILHKMRAGTAPFLALWYLPV